MIYAGGDSIGYVYAADGRKLRSISVISGVTVTADYCGNVIYENGVWEHLLVDGGYFLEKSHIISKHIDVVNRIINI